MKYLYLLLTQPHITNYLHGVAQNAVSAYPSLNPSDVEILEFEFPSYAEQQRVTDIYFNIDRKIALNRDINRNLEAMARQLYDYWFVQFDFPDENGKPYKSSGGKMVWDERLKREIPQIFYTKKVSEICEVLLGGTPNTTNPDYWNGETYWLNSGEVAEFPIITAEKKITQLGLLESATAFAKKGSVTLSITRHLRPSILAIDACINQSVVAIVPTDDFHNSLIYPYLVNEIPRLMSLRTGAQQPHINKETVETSIIALPPVTILNGYYKVVDVIYNRIITTAFETESLLQQRDELLPLLMNGQVSVKPIEVN